MSKTVVSVIVGLIAVAMIWQAVFPPESVSEVTPTVLAVNEQPLDDGTFAITVDLDVDGFSPVDTLGYDAFRIAEWLDANAAGKTYSSVEFVAVVPTVDKLGNKGTSKAFRIQADGGVIHRVNYDNATSWTLLNLVDLSDVKPVGRQVLVEYCGDPDNAENTIGFCRTVLAHLTRR